MDEGKKGLLIESQNFSCRTDKSRGKREFSKFFDKKIREQFEEDYTVPATKKAVAEYLDIDPDVFKKIVNQTQPAKYRDCIIAICFALRLNAEQSNEGLKYYDFPSLDRSLERDAIIIGMLNEQAKKKLSIEKINAFLRSQEQPELSIIDHRKRRDDKEQTVPNRFVIKGYHIETRLDEVLFDQYDSLATEYDPGRYLITAEMLLTDMEQGCDYELQTDLRGQFQYKKAGDLFYQPDHREDYGVFLPYYENLLFRARREQEKMVNVVHDSINYENRISARVIDNSLHIFTESFNYFVPELHLYHLMDYCDGVFTLMVAKKSRFMNYYLTKEEYERIYGKPENQNFQSYSSEESIRSAADNERNGGKRDVILQRLSAYRHMRERITNFAKLLDKDKYIWNPDIVDYQDIDLFERYGLAEQNPTGVAQDDLIRGFTLGLETIDEIQKFKGKYGTLNIQNIFIKQGLF